MRNLGTTLTSNVRNTGAGTVAATLLILLVVVVPAPVSAGTLLDRALEIAAARAFRAGQGAAATSTECLLAANAGTTEGGSEASFRYFGNGLIMPFYAVGKARQSPAEPPVEVLQRYPGQLGECFADGYRDARRRARAQTAFYGSLTTVSIVAVWLIVPALAGGDDFSDYYR